MPHDLYVTESIVRESVSLRHRASHRTRTSRPPSAFANTRWGRDELAGRHHYLPDGTYLRRSKRSTSASPSAPPGRPSRTRIYTVQLDVPSLPTSGLPSRSKPGRTHEFEHSGHRSLLEIQFEERKPPHVFSSPTPHPLRSSPVSRQTQSDDNDIPYTTTLRTPPRVPKLRHERRPLKVVADSEPQHTLHARHPNSQLAPAPASSPSPSKANVSDPLDPFQYLDSDQGSGSGYGSSSDQAPQQVKEQKREQDDCSRHAIRTATAAALQDLDQRRGLRFSPPPPPLHVDTYQNSRAPAAKQATKKRRHASSSSESSSFLLPPKDTKRRDTTSLKPGRMPWTIGFFGRHLHKSDRWQWKWEVDV